MTSVVEREAPLISSVPQRATIKPMRLTARSLIRREDSNLLVKCLKSRVKKNDLGSVPKFKSRALSNRTQILVLPQWLHLRDKAALELRRKNRTNSRTIMGMILRKMIFKRTSRRIMTMTTLITK
jgi:hypothetical protein